MSSLTCLPLITCIPPRQSQCLLLPPLPHQLLPHLFPLNLTPLLELLHFPHLLFFLFGWFDDFGVGGLDEFGQDAAFGEVGDWDFGGGGEGGEERG